MCTLRRLTRARAGGALQRAGRARRRRRTRGRRARALAPARSRVCGVPRAVPPPEQGTWPERGPRAERCRTPYGRLRAPCLLWAPRSSADCKPSTSERAATNDYRHGLLHTLRDLVFLIPAQTFMVLHPIAWTSHTAGIETPVPSNSPSRRRWQQERPRRGSHKT